MYPNILEFARQEFAESNQPVAMSGIAFALTPHGQILDTTRARLMGKFDIDSSMVSSNDSQAARLNDRAAQSLNGKLTRS